MCYIVFFKNIVFFFLVFFGICVFIDIVKFWFEFRGFFFCFCDMGKRIRIEDIGSGRNWGNV